MDPIDIIDGISLEKLIEKRTSNLMLQSAKQSITKATQKQYPDGISAYGTDALRFTFCALASNTRSVRFDIQRVEGYRNFCNKLWNASRYVLSHTVEEKVDFEDGPFQYSASDRWIRSKLQQVIQDTHQHYQNYRFDLLANTLYEFVWYEYCDWYLELSKTVLYAEDASNAMKRAARHTLIDVLTQVLKLLHPLMPFITEEVWLKIPNITDEPVDSIMLSQYPFVDESKIQPELEIEFDWLKKVAQAVRNIRSEMNISPAKRIPLLLHHASPQDRVRILKYEVILSSLLKLSEVQLLENSAEPPLCASAIIDTLELLIPMRDLIDKEAELQRLKKELQKLDQEIERAETKLSNPAFTDKAPREVIEKEEERLAQAKLARDKQLLHEEKIKTL